MGGPVASSKLAAASVAPAFSTILWKSASACWHCYFGNFLALFPFSKIGKIQTCDVPLGTVVLLTFAPATSLRADFRSDRTLVVVGSLVCRVGLDVRVDLFTYMSDFFRSCCHSRRSCVGSLQSCRLVFLMSRLVQTSWFWSFDCCDHLFSATWFFHHAVQFLHGPLFQIMLECNGNTKIPFPV